MNERPFEGGQYMTSHMGLQFDVAKDGEMYMMSQGPVAATATSSNATRRRGHRGRRTRPHQRQGGTWRSSPSPTTRKVVRLERGGHRGAAAHRPAKTASSAASRTRVRQGVRQARSHPKELLYYGSWGDDTDELTATVFDIDGPKRVDGPGLADADHHDPGPPGT